MMEIMEIREIKMSLRVRGWSCRAVFYILDFSPGLFYYKSSGTIKTS